MATFTKFEPFEQPAVVMDCGTGFTKMGFAGNLEVVPCPPLNWPTFVWYVNASGQLKSDGSAAKVPEGDNAYWTAPGVGVMHAA